MAYKTVNALFDDYDSAARAVRRLETSGIADLDIGLVASNLGGAYTRHATRSFDSDGETGETGEGAGAGAAIGTLAGGGAGLLAGLGLLALPGLGPVVAAGWLVATLVGAGAGAAVGGLIGALTESGVGEDEAQRVAEGVRRGGVLVTVRVRDADRDRVAAILHEDGRTDGESREAERRRDAPAPPIGAAASTTTGLTTDLMPDPFDDDGTEEAQDERLRRITGADRDRT